MSGDDLRVPGDLEQPLDWNKFLQADVCRSPQFAQVEIVLKGSPAQNNKTRVIRCVVASYLAHLRKDLIDLGVKDSPPADIDPAKNPASPPAPRNSLASREIPAMNGVNWANGDPAFKDGNTTVSISRSLIAVEQGGASARFYLPSKGSNAQGVQAIRLVPPPATSTEMYNTQTHQYTNTSPSSGDPTGNYSNGPPPGMMTKLAPFAQLAMKAINRAKQTPDGATWDDQYFRNILKPYNMVPASSAR
jgi:hypothetical protein